MIARDLEARKDTSTKGIGSEAVGTLKQDEVEKLVASFRQRAGEMAERVEPFSVKQHLSSISTSSDRAHFSVAREGASVLPYTGERYVSLYLQWDAPVLRHLSASDGYGIRSRTSLCMLLPGPADPEKIRMLVLRCVNPDAAPRAKSGGGAAPPNAAHADDLR